MEEIAMSKSALSLVYIAVGVVIGLLAGYFIFKENPPEPVATVAQQRLASHVDQFYYRLNDSMMSRHTVGVSDSGLYHTIDTLAVQPAVLPAK